MVVSGDGKMVSVKSLEKAAALGIDYAKNI
jgi:hypothetical protein